jgi:very-short-patch-repair endonuclease
MPRSKLAALEHFLKRMAGNVSDVNGLQKALKQYRRRMQQHPTRSEERFFKILHSIKGLGFIRNQKIILCHRPLKGYLLDFYLDDYQLAFEIDGKYHETEEQKKYDLARTSYLNGIGIKVVRIPNEKTKDEEECRNIIEKNVADRKRLMKIRDRIHYGKPCNDVKITSKEIQTAMQKYLENGGTIHRPNIPN